MTDRPPMTQTAPYPDALADLVDALTYRDGWSFSLSYVDRGQGSQGLTLIVRVECADSYDQTRRRAVLHYLPVPPAAFLPRDWRRWLLDQVLLIETHEACEFFTVDGVKPYAPNHGPGRNPYTVVEYADDVDRRTSFRGEVQS